VTRGEERNCVEEQIIRKGAILGDPHETMGFCYELRDDSFKVDLFTPLRMIKPPCGPPQLHKKPAIIGK
jgi:hypothetical protein